MNSLSLEKLDLVICNLEENIFESILRNPLAVQGMNSLCYVNLELVINNFESDNIKRILKDPTVVHGINSLISERLYQLIINITTNSYSERILKNPVAVEAINSLSTYKFEVILFNIEEKYVEDILTNPVAVERVNSLTDENLQVLRELDYDDSAEILRNPVSLAGVNSLNTEKLGVIVRCIEVCANDVLRDPAAVEGVNALNIEKLELVLNNNNMNFILNILKNPDVLETVLSWSDETLQIIKRKIMLEPSTLQAVISLNEQKLKAICKIRDRPIIRLILEDPVAVGALNTMSAEKVEIMKKMGRHFIENVLMNCVSLEGVNTLATEKFKAISKISSNYVQLILEEPAAVESMQSLSVEKLEVITNNIQETCVKEILQNPVALETIFSWNEEKLRISREQKIISLYTFEGINSMSVRSLKVLGRIDNYIVKTDILGDPVAIACMNSLSTEKLQAVIDIIEAEALLDVLKDSSTIKKIEDVDIKRNFRFAPIFLDESDTTHLNKEEFAFLLDSEDIYKSILRFINSRDFGVEERVLLMTKAVLHSVFHDTEGDDWRYKLQQLSLFEFLKTRQGTFTNGYSELWNA